MLDYIITPEKGAGRCLQDYRWGSPASLYTFQENKTHLGSARGSLGYISEDSPNSPSFSHSGLLRKGPKFQSFALPLSYLGVVIYAPYEKIGHAKNVSEFRKMSKPHRRQSKPKSFSDSRQKPVHARNRP